MRGLLLITAATFVGCVGPAAPAEEWHLGGSFTTDRTQADVDAVCEAGAGDAPCTLMASHRG